MLSSRASLTFSTLIFLVSALVQAAQIHKPGEPGLTPPKVASKVEPQYTKEARQAKIQGATALTLVVNEKGRPESIRVKTSLDAGLDQKAIAAVKQWKFEPARIKGKPVSIEANIQVNWRLLP